MTFHKTYAYFIVYCIIFPQKLQSELSVINNEFNDRYDAVEKAFDQLEGMLHDYKEEVKIDDTFIL